MSDPLSSAVSPAASAAAEPPDDPPGVRAVSQGLFVVPKRSLEVWKSASITGTLLFPRR